MTTNDLEQVTRILARFAQGEDQASEELLLAIYDELRRMAEGQMRRENVGHTLQPTALVHELWRKLSAQESRPSWPSRGHFFGWMSKAMGNFLRDYARHKSSLKAGGDQIVISLEGGDLLPGGETNEEIVDVLDAIGELGKVDEKLGSIVELRVFGGLSYLEIADSMELSESQVDRSLQAARAWLRVRLSQ